MSDPFYLLGQQLSEKRHGFGKGDESILFIFCFLQTFVTDCLVE